MRLLIIVTPSDVLRSEKVGYPLLTLLKVEVVVKGLLLSASCLLLSIVLSSRADAIPTFARAYDVSCATCHVVPPKLNSAGQEFAANRYQFPDLAMVRTSTVPVALWISMLGHQQSGRDFMRGFPNRIELIASDVLTSSWSYFLEWRPLSIDLRGDGTLRDRSGRFEDIFLIANLSDGLSTTIGQYRMLSQIDVSQRVSVSEPLPFSSGLAGERSPKGRITSLRSFSPSGRSPAVRLQYHTDLFGTGRNSDGFFAVVTLPSTGEFSLPLTNEARTEASFEFEAKPKGIFLESFVRRGLTSIGMHFFGGSNERHLVQMIGSARLGDLFITAALGTGKVGIRKLSNMMLESEYQPVNWGILAFRLEHQTGSGRDPSMVPYAVVHFPGTEYTFRVTMEHRIQKDNEQTFIETSVIF